MTISDEMRRMLTRLEQERDELRVKLNLAKHEMRDEWQEVEKRWSHVQGRLKGVGEEAGEAGDDARAALKLAMEDLRDHLKRMRERL